MLKKRSCVWVFATNSVVTTSSSLVDIPCRPLPPRFCARKSTKAVRLIYPAAVMVTTISSRSIRSSSIMSPDHSIISVRRGTAKFVLTSFSSSAIIPIIRSREDSIARYSLIFTAKISSSSVTSLTPI